MSDLSLHLVLPEGGTSRRRLPQGKVTLGRGRTCEIAIPDPLMSRRHAEFERQGQDLIVRDLGSRNGILVNGTRITEAISIRPGDRLQIGGTVIELVGPEATNLVLVDTDPSTHSHTVLLDARKLLSTKESSQKTAIRHLQALVDASRALVAHLPEDELLEKILDLVRSHIPADRAAVMLADPQLGALHPRLVKQSGAVSEFVLSRTLAQQVLEERQSVLTTDVLADRELAQAESLILQGVRSILCAPLLSEQKVLGLLYLDAAQLRGFDADDLRLLTALANFAAIKLENLKLIDDALERKALEGQIEAATKVQRHLLPRSSPVLPGYDLHAELAMCWGVGGDYFDWYLHADGRLSGAIADVSGKGMSAALIMATFQSTWRELVRAGMPLEEAAKELNQLLFERTPPERFATAVLFELESKSAVLQLVCAGHEPPLLIRSSKGKVEALKPDGRPLGLFSDSAYRSAQVELAPGDLLLLYTDGASERPNAAEEQFGRQRLVQTLLGSRQRSCAEIAREIQSQLESHAAGEDPPDDTTLVLIRRQDRAA
ncbi:MAG TPA: SpoIIE family protein phosphatase [Acidobacteriota bacterium]|jgi:serine phosphatase RsbU (regulator of sigma subunit)/pSer/pThr/pTyr-binding forkhead associated (FHA) protein